MDAGYPKQIQTELPGIGNRVDAAFENKGAVVIVTMGVHCVAVWYNPNNISPF